MPLPKNMVTAVYEPSCIPQYKDNPLIEALPPLMNTEKVICNLLGEVQFDPKAVFAEGRERAHVISSLLDNFFQPLTAHIQLEEKVSIMMRQGYVGRNLADGSLNMHMQNGYERVMTGTLEAFKFEHAKSTASSLSLIGCSGSGKTTTVARIFATYPQVIYHKEYNFTQITYLKIDCPHDGTLKNLCIQFFRAIDRVLHTDYETKYTGKRHGIEKLLAMMSQVANLHAIGVLIIDEIQHLDRRRSGGVEKMLNFFVTLVNTIGLPVIFVGTPKARPIFEKDLRSARRGAGLGALIWEPMKDPDSNPRAQKEWQAFTNKLWKYQWLQKRDETLNEDLRAHWFNLSQGVLDIVVKLFVLSQLRAISTGIERITPGLMQQVYDDELQPVHPMLSALRSGDPERIAEYSDLIVPNIDEKLLELTASIRPPARTTQVSFWEGNSQAQRLYNLLVGMECDEDRITPLVERVLDMHPDLSTSQMIAIALEWYESPSKPRSSQKAKSVPLKKWHTLNSEDLRFLFSQSGPDEMYEQLKQNSMIFEVEDWLRKSG
ncbi:AAA family ATPase [Pseudodesulfovibrio indicus]|uniref:Tn7 transposition regulator TnsC n=1 Tax=Pseudodesulfovibrio indicus TaxID=1716143 RepID=A0A126QRK3_9BACT|nr:AAA family ATPase [Pseudodesulfovibrio indicus]AMK12690.1 transcriptional antiterminator [Pseudodesulfovibrio indicus]TDT91009.1 Tn7 transposition regulator TnsC [Pseudodesulfovibrio indicus]